MKKCKQGYYYCYKDKKCKKIPLGYRIGLGGWLRKEKDEETEEKKKNGNGNGANGNGNGNGESDGGSNGGGVSEAWSSKYKKSIDCDNPKGFSQRAHCRGRKKVSEEAVSKKQQKFFGIVRAIQKGELEPTTPETAKAAATMKKSDVKDFASTKHKGLPEKKKMNEQSCPICNCDPCQCLEGNITEARDGKSSKDKGYSLRDWFKGGGWKQTGGKYDGKPCAKQPGQKTKPYCRDADDRAAMSKEERNKRARKKRKEDPNPNRKGKAKNVTQESYSDWRKDFEISEQSGYGVITVGNQTVRIGNQPSRPSMRVRSSMPARPSMPSPSVSQPVSRPMPTSTSSSTAITSANNTRLRQAQQSGREIGNMTGTSGLMNTTINTANRTQSRYDMLRQVMRQAGMAGANQNMNLRGVPMRNSYEPEGEVVTERDAWGSSPMDRIMCRDGVCRNEREIEELRKKRLKEKGVTLDKAHYEPQGQVIPEDAFDPNFVDRKRREQDRPKDKVAQPPAEKFIDTRPPADFRDKVPNTPNTMRPGSSGGRNTNSMRPGSSGGRNTNSIKAKPLATLNRGEKGDGFLGPTITIGKKRIGIPNISPIRNEEVEAVEEGKKDACYHKVKSRYSVWPSAYASGALVKCRKVGAKNWGNKTKKESVDYSNWRDDFQALEIETIDLIKADPIEVPPSRIDIIKEGAKKRNQTLDEMSAPQVIRLGLAAGTAIAGGIIGKGAIDSVKKMVDKKKKQLDDAEGLSNSYEPEGEALDEKCWKGYEKKGMKTMFGKRYPNCVKKKKTRKEEVDLGEAKNGGDNDPCWDTHKQVGMKKKGGKMVPNCVPKEEYSDWRADMNIQEAIPGYDKYNAAVAAAKKLTGRAKIEALKAAAALRPKTEKEVSEPLGEGAAWTKKEGKNKSGGLNEKGRKSYERENPGSDLKRPSKKVGNKRRASFCARMKGMKKKLTSKKTANDPDSRINKSLRAWNC